MRYYDKANNLLVSYDLAVNEIQKHTNSVKALQGFKAQVCPNTEGMYLASAVSEFILYEC